jgi:hypothetical protein
MRSWFVRVLFLLALLSGATGAPAQTWQMPNTDLGSRVPKPQGPRIPTPGNFIEDEQARTRAINQSVRDGQDRYYTEKARREQLVQEAADELAGRAQGQAQFDAEFEARNKPQYEAAYDVLHEMLTGQRPANLSLAVFVVENSYAAGELRYADLKATLAELVDICHGLAGPRASPAARFMALHQLMTDTVRVSYKGKVLTSHLPYHYDFQDFRGEKDYTKMFVTKLLRTNSGNCHSLPLLYKLVADQLGVKSYLSLAPNHSFIQVKDNAGHLYRYETTNGHFVTEAYYMSTGYIKAGALKSGAYLDTLTMRQTLACQVLDLALGYEHYYGPDEFMERCAALALTYYPQGIQGHLVAYNAALAHFNFAATELAPPSFAAALQVPALKKLWAAVERQRAALDALGFEEMPKEKYTTWLHSLEAEKARLESRHAAGNFQQASAR